MAPKESNKVDQIDELIARANNHKLLQSDRDLAKKNIISGVTNLEQLQKVVKNCELVILTNILEKDRSFANKVEEDGTTALMVTAITGRIPMVEELFKYGAKSSFEAKDKNGLNVLMHTVKHSHCDMVKFLLSSGFDKYIDEVDNYGVTALMYCIKLKTTNLGVLNILLQYGADKTLHYKNSEQKTAFMLACEKKDEHVIKALLANKLGIYLTLEQWETYIEELSDLSLISLLTENMPFTKSHPKFPKPSDSTKKIMNGLTYRTITDLNSLRPLINHETNFNQREERGGNTLVHIIAQKGSYEKMQYVLGLSEVRLDILNFDGKSALDVALMYGNSAAVRAFMEYLAIDEADNANINLSLRNFLEENKFSIDEFVHDLNINNEHYQSPLTAAVKAKDVAIIHNLLKLGANPVALDGRGKSAIEICEEYSGIYCLLTRYLYITMNTLRYALEKKFVEVVRFAAARTRVEELSSPIKGLYSNKSAIHVLALQDDVDVMEILFNIIENAKDELKSKLAHALLEGLIEDGSIALVDRLISLEEFKVTEFDIINAVDKEKFELLDMLMEAYNTNVNSYEVVNSLISKKKLHLLPLVMDKLSITIDTNIFCAAIKENVKEILDQCIDNPLIPKNAVVIINREELTPMFCAIKYKNKRIFDALLEHPEVPITIVTLNIAILSQHEYFIEKILASSKLQDDIEESFIKAVEKGKANIVEIFIKYCDNLNLNLNGNEQSTPLIIACEKGVESIVKILLDSSRVEVNKTVDSVPEGKWENLTAIWIAAASNNIPILQLLCQHNGIIKDIPSMCAKFSAKTLTPLKIAQEKEYSDVIEILSGSRVKDKKVRSKHSETSHRIDSYSSSHQAEDMQILFNRVASLESKVNGLFVMVNKLRGDIKRDSSSSSGDIHSSGSELEKRDSRTRARGNLRTLRH